MFSSVVLQKGTPEYLRSDNGSEFIAKALREWLSEMDIAPMYTTPGSPWENGFVESVNGTMANELLNRELFDTLEEAKVLLARWVREYNTKPPHSSTNMLAWKMGARQGAGGPFADRRRSFTGKAVSDNVSGCGILAEVKETDTPGKVEISFPNTPGIPDDFPKLRPNIECIVPCHLEIDYVFLYILWRRLEEKLPSWAVLTRYAFTWKNLERFVRD